MCETNKYERLERLLHYYKPGSLNIIGGRPGMGKTTFVVNIAVQYNKPVAFFSLEMSESDLNKVEGFTNSKGLIFVDDPVQFKVGDFQQRLRQMKKEHDIQVAIVDYLQLMNVDLPNKSEISRNDELRIIASGLKAIAEELQIPIIVTSQLSRTADHRPGKKPILDDLCSSILDSVDDVHLLYRASYYGLNENPEEKIEFLSTEKNYGLGDILLLENKIDVLRRRLHAVEEEILRIAKPFDHIMNDAEEELVCEHLSTRSYILNRMFDLHATEAEIHRFEEVNERLFNLTKDFNKRHQDLQQQLSSIVTLNGEPLELSTSLYYHHDPDNPQLYHMEDDDFYGSRWNEMLFVISETTHIEAELCYGNNLDNFDDGTTWAEGPLCIPQFEHICICHLVHALCTHQNYSIPDLLRMTTYHYNYQLDNSVDIIHL